MSDSKQNDIVADAYGPVEFGAESPEEAEELVRMIAQAADMEKATQQRKGSTASYAEKVAILEILQEAESREKFKGHFKLFPDDGPYSYDKYVKHLMFFAAGTEHRERIFMAANRSGKSIAGGYEMTCHLTGIYPHWWEGKRFPTHTDCWAAGDTSQTTRDIVQSVLMGDVGNFGTGLIPDRLIEDIRMRPGVPGGVDSIKVLHTSGGYSKLGFKSFDQKRRSFQGTAKHVIWLDEEAPQEVYGESLIRTMTTGGIIYVTFTPLQGMTPFVTEFQKAVMEQELSRMQDSRHDNSL